jgi:hypothetical protein
MNNFLLGVVATVSSGVIFAADIGKITCDFSFIPQEKIDFIDPHFGVNENFKLDWVSMPDQNNPFSKRIELKNIIAEVNYSQEAFEVSLFRPVTDEWIMTGTILPLPIAPPTDQNSGKSVLGMSQDILMLDLPVVGEASFECDGRCLGRVKFVYNKISVWCTGILKAQ